MKSFWFYIFVFLIRLTWFYLNGWYIISGFAQSMDFASSKLSWNLHSVLVDIHETTLWQYQFGPENLHFYPFCSLRKAVLPDTFYIIQILPRMSSSQFGQNNHGLKLFESTDVIWNALLILVELFSSSFFTCNFNIQVRLNCYR